MTTLRVAWRNLWRNPRRTALTAAATVFAIALTLWSLALATGSHARWIDSSVRLYPGHIEVSARGYRENQTLDYGMTLGEAQKSALDRLPTIEGWAPRLEAWALAIPDVEGSLGRAARLIGVDPGRETHVSRLGAAVEKGRLPEGTASEVVLGVTLAENLAASIGDEVILLSTDYYGSQAADRFRVVGLLSVGDTRFDSYVALMALPTLQRFLEFDRGVSHVALFLENGEETAAPRTRLEETFDPEHFEIVAWPQLIPDVVQFMLLDDVGNYVTLGILIVVVAFGILNTILMSVFERTREFGVMRAVGMRPRAVFALVMAESSFLALLGIAIGVAIGIPLLLWFEQNPIEFTSPEWQLVSEAFHIDPVVVFDMRRAHLIFAPVAILVVSLVAALPPAIRASRGRPVDALREL